MEAEKIIKGLEICASVEENCDKCPYEGCYDCSQTLKEDTLALIKSQQAQIEELTEKVCVLREELEIGTNEHLMTIHDLKKKNEELSNKHWGECRQIACYSDFVSCKERLTVQSEVTDGYWLKAMCDVSDEIDCEEMCSSCNHNCNECPIQIAVDRLAAYENTGLSPEKIVKINTTIKKVKEHVAKKLDQMILTRKQAEEGFYGSSGGKKQ